MIAVRNRHFIRSSSPPEIGPGGSAPTNLGFLKLSVPNRSAKSLALVSGDAKWSSLVSVKAMEGFEKPSGDGETEENFAPELHQSDSITSDDALRMACDGKSCRFSTFRNSTNIAWHKNPVEKIDMRESLQQRGCVIWITGLSGSGKSTLASALSRGLHSRGKLTYVLYGDNARHGLNYDLNFKEEDRAENIQRIGEVAKLFADAGFICITSLISPYRKDRDACRALLPGGEFIEVFMDVPLKVCEARDPKGLYKLARAGKIKGFTGINDPYEPPLNSEIVLQQEEEACTPDEMAATVISYLEEKGYLGA
ncbi:adenylyl-sulfate kinase 3-like isoform X1 [Diospyros lotus]|uniref:adenylyl-sulfate kinase 3-like isoform X1 n=1 Tax=Diospyros lotus TaxID=55363 RepID=UPI002252A17F|nr:adenylyl-sulfate kinase 3-like isoform X1 [Diospyros lotus]